MKRFQYVERILSMIEDVENQERESIEKAVETVREAIEKKHSLFAFGASHAGILTQELYYRAGGLVVVNPIFAPELSLDVEPISHTSQMERLEGYGKLLAKKTPFQKGDVLLVHSVSGRNPVTIDLVLEAVEKGVTVIAITNLAYSSSVTSRHSCGKNLYQIAQVVIDNHGDIGDACCGFDGMNQKTAPSSTVIGAMIVNIIVSETVKALLEKGVDPVPVFYSANLDGGDDLNKKVSEEYKDVIHYRL